MVSERVPFTAGIEDFPIHGHDGEYTDADVTDVATDVATTKGYDGTAGTDVGTTVPADGYTDGNGVQVATEAQSDAQRTIDGIPIPPQYVPTEGGADATGCVAESEPLINVLPDGIEIIDGVAHIRDDTPDRVQVVVRVDPDFKQRIVVVSNLERRTMTVVVEEAVRRFMSVPINEPRPYLPPELSRDQGCRLAFYLTSGDKHLLEARAKVECRSVMDLVRRALADYVDASPYDPERYMRVGKPTGTAQNPSTTDEGVERVSEYLPIADGRLEPSEAQKTADDPSEGVTE